MAAFFSCVFSICVLHVFGLGAFFSSSIWLVGLLGGRNVQGQTKFIPRAGCFKLKYPTNYHRFYHIFTTVTYKIH